MKPKNQSLLVSIVLFSLLICVVYSLPACNQRKKPSISIEKFKEDSLLMLKITNKFANETDGKRLFKASVAVQQSRMLACTNVLKECDMYGKFVSKAIELSRDGTVSLIDRKIMLQMYQELRTEINDAKEVLYKR